MISMKLLGAAAAAALVGAVTVAATGGHAAASCTPQTAWYGAEDNALGSGAPAVVTWPVTQPLTVTSTTLSASLVPTGGAPPGGGSVDGWGETLVLTGISPTSNPEGAWVTDPSFGAPNGYSGPWHGNQPTDGMLAAAILKTQGGAAANQTVTAADQVAATTGDWLYLAVGAAGPTADVEVQVEITYTPAGC